MEAEILTAAGRRLRSSPRQLRGLVPSGDSVGASVAEIIAGVRAEGDAAVKRYTRAARHAVSQAAAAASRSAASSASARAQLDPDVAAGHRAGDRQRRAGRARGLCTPTGGRVRLPHV